MTWVKYSQVSFPPSLIEWHLSLPRDHKEGEQAKHLLLNPDD